jgi:hypothetical protein
LDKLGSDAEKPPTERIAFDTVPSDVTRRSLTVPMLFPWSLYTVAPTSSLERQSSWVFVREPFGDLSPSANEPGFDVFEGALPLAAELF